jgi:hypothetical protein
VYEKAALTRWHESIMESVDTLRLTPAYYVQALHAQLRETHASLPSHQEGQQNRKYRSYHPIDQKLTPYISLR